MKLLTLLFASLVALVAATPEESVKAALDQYAAAAHAGDAATLDKMIHKDLAYSHSNGKMENKAEAMAGLVKSKALFEYKDTKVHVYGNTAVMNTIAVSANNKTGLSLLLVWVKNGGQWQLAARQATRLP